MTIAKIIVTLTALFFSFSARASEFETPPTPDDVRALIIEVTGEDIEDVDELRPLIGVDTFDEWYDVDEEVVCGPYSSVDEDGHCERYYQLKRSIEETIERMESVEEEGQFEDELEEKIWLDYYDGLEYGPSSGCSSGGIAGSGFGGIFLCLSTFGLLLGLKRRNLNIRSG